MPFILKTGMHISVRKQTAVTGRLVNTISNDFEGGVIREVSGANYVPIFDN